MDEFIVIQAHWDTGGARVTLDSFTDTTEAISSFCALLETVGFARESIRASLQEIARDTPHRL